jgi:subtilisin family serine protease
MAPIVRNTALASLIAACLAAGAVSTARAADTAAMRLVRFAEPGALAYRGGTGALRPTAPAANRRFDANAPDVAAYRAWLGGTQAQHRADIAARLGRAVDLAHTYQMTHSGIALALTDAEAAAVAALPGVVSVEAEPIYPLATYRGPTFIGAGTVWNTAPSDPVRRGRGTVVGVIDSGANPTHPSFANDASCGFNAADPKLKSYRDCMTSDNGVCNGSIPEDYNTGHGVHTASTAAGNTVTLAATPAPVLPAPYTQMSGVAPCASVRTYKVCDSSTCNGSAILAAIENIVVDGDIDVANYSISGGRTPWSMGDIDLEFLDLVNAGVLVVAAAGNTSLDEPDPVGKVNHIGPWMTTVAAVTHDAVALPALTVVAPTQPASLADIAVKPGSTTPPANDMSNLPLKTYSANPIGCTADGGIAANALQGAIAVLRRGTCTFGEKITNAANAGAVAVVIGNNQSGVLTMDTAGAANIPAYSISSVAVGDALAAYANDNAGAAASFDLTHRQGNRLADFSQRGPTIEYYRGLTKPDVSAPGVGIYAAQTPGNGQYGEISGTSMASPHVAGAALLVRAAHPAWSPMAVKSALQMTAQSGGFQEDGVSASKVDQIGSGLVDVAAAVRAGLVMEETYDNFVAANPSVRGVALDALNLPSLRNRNCSPTCTFTRTVTSTLASASTWNATFASDTDGVTAETTPSTFTLPAGGSQTITVTVKLGVGNALAAAASGALTLTEAASQAPPAHLSVTVLGTRPRDAVFGDGLEAADMTNIVAVDNLNYVFPLLPSGGAVNWQTGALCNQTNDCFYGNYHFNIWTYTNAQGSIAAINHPLKEPREDYGSVVLPGTMTFVVMQRGETIGPQSTFSAVASQIGAEQWRAAGGVDGYIGFRFRNTATNQINYGYARFITQGPVGLPATLVGYRYDASGAPITIR